MLKEFLKDYRKQAIKSTFRKIYDEHYGCHIYCIYDSSS